MLENKSIAVLIPAYKEEKLIQQVVGTLPDWVDHIIVVDDASPDRTVEKVKEAMKTEPRLHLIQHEKNRGVGGSLSTGYIYCRDQGYDVTVVMNGDAQMDPEDLPAIARPVAEGKTDYAKGNRLFHGQAWKVIPKIRYLGNSVLSLLTKVASGYWHVADSQCGFTAISKKALSLIDLGSLFERYGVPNDILAKLNIESLRVMDVAIRPVYNVGEVSGIRMSKVIPDISLLLLRCFFRRLIAKYVIRDFHPLVFFYIIGILSFPTGTTMGFYYFYYRIAVGVVPPVTALFAAFLTLTGMIFLLFAMLFDMEYNKHLKS